MCFAIVCNVLCKDEEEDWERSLEFDATRSTSEWLPNDEMETDASNEAEETEEPDETIANPFECLVCGLVVSRKHSLKRHYFTHNNAWPWRCVFCGKGAACKSQLEIHHRTHTGERPHRCAVCGRSFNQRSTLNRHVASRHTNSFP